MPREKEFIEADIVINNTTLTLAQAMVVRVALESFSMHLLAEGLGADKLGKHIAKNYQDRLNEIRALLYENIMERSQ